MKVTLCDRCGFRIDTAGSVAVKVSMNGSNPRLEGEIALDYCDDCAGVFYGELAERPGLTRVARPEGDA